jgi:hypothetical protein
VASIGYKDNNIPSTSLKYPVSLALRFLLTTVYSVFRYRALFSNIGTISLEIIQYFIHNH